MPINLSEYSKKLLYKNEKNCVVCYLLTSENDSRKIFLKEISYASKEKESEKTALRKIASEEALVSKRLSNLSSFVAKYYDSWDDRKNGKFYLASEFLNGVTLREWMNSHPIKKTEYDITERLIIVLHICSTLSDLCSKSNRFIIHRDIKPENIMICGKRVYIIDFGQTTYLYVKRTGTSQYRAPEQNEPKKFGVDPSYKTDIYSAGLILYELLKGHLPEGEDDFVRDVEELDWEVWPSVLPLKHPKSKEIEELFRGMTALWPEDRWEYNQIISKLKKVTIKKGAGSKNGKK